MVGNNKKNQRGAGFSPFAIQAIDHEINPTSLPSLQIKGGTMNQKLMDNLRNLLTEIQGMETGAIKDYHLDNAKGYNGDYYRGKAKVCEILKRRLTEILYEEKVERMPRG